MQKSWRVGRKSGNRAETEFGFVGIKRENIEIVTSEEIIIRSFEEQIRCNNGTPTGKLSGVWIRKEETVGINLTFEKWFAISGKNKSVANWRNQSTTSSGVAIDEKTKCDRPISVWARNKETPITGVKEIVRQQW